MTTMAFGIGKPNSGQKLLYALSYFFHSPIWVEIQIRTSLFFARISFFSFRKVNFSDDETGQPDKLVPLLSTPCGTICAVAIRGENQSTSQTTVSFKEIFKAAQRMTGWKTCDLT